jgi:hypothetical protein
VALTRYERSGLTDVDALDMMPEIALRHSQDYPLGRQASLHALVFSKNPEIFA